MFPFFKKKAAPQSLEQVVLVGAGEVGFHLARRLAEEGRPVIVIDIDAERLRAVKDGADVQTLLGSGTSPKLLKEAGVEEASVFLAVTDNDEVNVTACLLANALSPSATKLARIRNAEYKDYPQIFGSDGLNIHLMVNPEEALARTIDRLLSLPAALDYAEFADGKVRLVGYEMEEAPFIGEPLTKFRSFVGVEGIMVAAIVRDGVLHIPDGKDTIKRGDSVYFAYLAEAQRPLLRALGRTRGFFHSACIMGGGNIGMRLASIFEEKGMDIKLIEKNAERCEELVDLLPQTLILHGDATERGLLRQENIGKMDVVVALTGDEETNFLACLLAKSLGARETVARVNKSAYIQLTKLVGIEHSVSPRQAAVSSFLKYIRKGHVLAAAQIHGEDAEMLETFLPANSSFVGTAVRELGLPHGVLLLATLRGEVAFIPKGDTVLEQADHLFFLGTKETLKSLEARLGEVKN